MQYIPALVIGTLLSLVGIVLICLSLQGFKQVFDKIKWKEYLDATIHCCMMLIGMIIGICLLLGGVLLIFEWMNH
jgi:uncharacterized membrane protein YidH (DUF202 family)